MDISFRAERAILSKLSFTLPTSMLQMCRNLWCYQSVGVLDYDWIACLRPHKQRKSGFFLRLLHNRKQRALFAFLTIVPIKSQVYPQQQTKQSSSRNIQDLKVFGNFVSGCVFLLFFLFSKSRNYLVKFLVTHTFIWKYIDLFAIYYVRALFDFVIYWYDC